MTASNDRLSALLAELRQLLEEERSALLSGVPARITAAAKHKLDLAEKIERECDAVAAAPANVGILTWLARYNRENSVICSAMLQHMTRAIDKLRRNEPHRSYGPDGAEHSATAQRPLGAA